MCYFIIPHGTGFDQSARGLAALYYVELPIVGQVVCWHLSLLLLEAVACRAIVRWAGVTGRKGCPHEKRLRIPSIHIVQAGSPLIDRLLKQPAGRALLNLLNALVG